MSQNYYELINDTIFVFRGSKKTLEFALICNNSQQAEDALMLLKKGYALRGVAQLVNGTLTSTN
jgi:hypothetical protein